VLEMQIGPTHFQFREFEASEIKLIQLRTHADKEGWTNMQLLPPPRKVMVFPYTPHIFVVT
jgi:hypothetical protein